MNLYRNSTLFEIFLMLIGWTDFAVAQQPHDAMMDAGMMASGWLMIVCLLLGVLFLVLLVLGILALLKYLLGK